MSRIGIAMNYRASSVRQQEDPMLGLSPALVRAFPRRLRALLGYGEAAEC
jgi:hypothetical protein